jgi:hypothetical protein
MKAQEPININSHNCHESKTESSNELMLDVGAASNDFDETREVSFGRKEPSSAADTRAVSSVGQTSFGADRCTDEGSI